MNNQDEKVFDDARPIVVVIGNFAHEGLTAKIESLGFKVVNRNLRSTAKNWTKIIDLLRTHREQCRLAAVFLYMPSPTLLQCADPDYAEVRGLLVAELEKSPSIAFVHEENLKGSIEPFPWEVKEPQIIEDEDDLPWPTQDLNFEVRSRHGLLTVEEWKENNRVRIDLAIAFLKELVDRRVDVAPFKKRSDVTIRMFEALEDSQAGIFLRLYVPHGRYQSEQFEDFLTLFSRYLREVEKKEFSIDANRTSKGTTYVFKGRGDASTVDDLQAAVKRFDDFLQLSEVDPAAAGKILEGSGIDTVTSSFLVAKYSRQMKRLKLDIRHEFERKRLLIGQALEVDIVEGVNSDILPMPSESRPSSLLSVVGNLAPVSITIIGESGVAISSAAVQNMVVGDVNYVEQDRTLIDLISSLADEVQALKLRSDLDRLKDPATAPSEKRTAMQRLKSFLYTSGKYAAKKVDEVGTQLLVTYLERLCGLS